MKMKKMLSIMLITSFVLTSLVGCGSNNSSTINTATTTQQETQVQDTTTQVIEQTSGYNSPIVTSGQTATYDEDGNVITISQGDTLYGQDGNYASLDFSFTKNADGTTTDHNTGLMWETIPMGGKSSWEDAIAYCNELELGGYDDWRIPTVEELFSISDFSVGWPYLDTDYFSFDDSGDSAMMAGGGGDGSPQGNSQSGGPQGGSSGEPQGGGGGMPGGPQSGEGGMPPMMGEGEMPEGMEGGMPPMMGEGEIPEGMEGGMPPMMGEGEIPEGMEGGMPPMMGEGEMPEGVEGGTPPMMGEGEMPAGMEGGTPPMMGEGEGSNSPPPSGDGDSGASKDDGQFWTASHNMVEGDSRLGDIAFGVNHSTGHIKAYPAESTPMMGKYVRAVRGDVYGAEDYTNNGDGTVTDNASGLMWLESDLGVTVDWMEALELAENYEFAGYDDWRLPDVKELQSIVDYGGSYPAINHDYFDCTESDINENYYYWTNTSAYFSPMAQDYDSAWYVAFGYTSHGAGAVRFSPKYEGSEALSEGEDNILNSVRLVRNAD